MMITYDNYFGVILLFYPCICLFLQSSWCDNIAPSHPRIGWHETGARICPTGSTTECLGGWFFELGIPWITRCGWVQFAAPWCCMGPWVVESMGHQTWKRDVPSSKLPKTGSVFSYFSLPTGNNQISAGFPWISHQGLGLLSLGHRRALHPDVWAGASVLLWGLLGEAGRWTAKDTIG